MHVALDDAGFAHTQVADHQQLVHVLLVRGLHPGGPPVLQSLEPALEAQPGLGCRTETQALCGREGRAGVLVQAGELGRNSSPGVNPPSYTAVFKVGGDRSDSWD